MPIIFVLVSPRFSRAAMLPTIYFVAIVPPGFVSVAARMSAAATLVSAIISVRANASARAMIYTCLGLAHLSFIQVLAELRAPTASRIQPPTAPTMQIK